MPDWLKDHESLLVWLGVASAVMFVGTLVALPIAVSRIPEDYFAHDRRERRDTRHPLLRLALRVSKNVLGAVFVLAGIAMLVLPGQGILTILIGLGLLDFPGKYRLERKLVSRPAVLRSLNWIRRKAGRPPLRVDGLDEDRGEQAPN